MPSEAHKRASKKWDAANMTNLSIKIRRSYAEQIRQATAQAGTTPSAIMRKAIDDFMEEHNKKDTSSDLWKETPAWDLDNPNVRSYIRQELEKNK